MSAVLVHPWANATTGAATGQGSAPRACRVLLLVLDTMSLRSCIPLLRYSLAGLGIGLGMTMAAQITWRRTYGGFGADDAASVRQTSDGGYIIAGTAGSFGHGASDIYVMRVDEQGEPLWSRTYGGAGVEQGVACRELTDGYIIAGYTSLGANGSYDMLLIHIDPSGAPLWEKHYGTADWDLCNALDVLPDGFALGGISYGPGTPAGAVYIVRTDLNGDTLWTSRSPSAFRAECVGLTHTADGGLAIAGRVGTASGPDDGFLMKMSATGEEEWTTTVGGDSTDYLASVSGTSIGELVACGATRSWSSALEIYLVGFHPDGTVAWEERQGNGSDAAAAEIRPDHEDGYVFTGYNTLNLGERDIILTTTYPNGGFHFGNNYGDGRPADGRSIDTTADGGYVVAGWCEQFGPGLRSMYVVKTDGQGQTASLNVETYFDPLDVPSFAARESPAVFPDPVEAGGLVTLRFTGDSPYDITLTDLQGRVVFTQRSAALERSFRVPELAAGPYVLKAHTRSAVLLSHPLVIQR